MATVLSHFAFSQVVRGTRSRLKAVQSRNAQHCAARAHLAATILDAMLCRAMLCSSHCALQSSPHRYQCLTPGQQSTAGHSCSAPCISFHSPCSQTRPFSAAQAQARYRRCTYLPVQPMLHVCPQALLQRGEESKAVPWALNVMAACIDAEIPLQRLLGIAWRIAAFCSIVTPVSRLNEKYMVCCPHASRHLQHKEWPNRSWH